MKPSQGFTLIELLIVVAIIGLLSFVAIAHFSSRTDAEMRVLRDAIVLELEEAKAAALAGAGGEAHGVHFAADAYTRFRGSTYVPEDPENETYTVSERLQIETALSGGAEAVIFSRVTGAVATPGTITVVDQADPDHTRSIIVGARGDITLSD